MVRFALCCGIGLWWRSALLALFSWSACQGFGLSQQGSNRTRDRNSGLVVQVTASQTLVKVPPRGNHERLYCEPPESDEVRLSANATNPHKTEMTFTWQVPVGRLIGKDREVVWDLSGVPEGTYTATVEASDRLKNTAGSSVEVTVVICPNWFLPDPPPCPVVSVSCPVKMERKEQATFVATVAGGNTDVKLTYEWSLSAGKIISGKATPKIVVDVSDLNNDSVTATVKIGGVNPSCITDASCTIQLAEPE